MNTFLDRRKAEIEAQEAQSGSRTITEPRNEEEAADDQGTQAESAPAETDQTLEVTGTELQTPPSSPLPQSTSEQPTEGEELVPSSTTLAAPSTSPQITQSAAPTSESPKSPSVFKRTRSKGKTVPASNLDKLKVRIKVSKGTGKADERSEAASVPKAVSTESPHPSVSSQKGTELKRENLLLSNPPKRVKTLKDRPPPKVILCLNLYRHHHSPKRVVISLKGHKWIHPRSTKSQSLSLHILSNLGSSLLMLLKAKSQIHFLLITLSLHRLPMPLLYHKQRYRPPNLSLMILWCYNTPLRKGYQLPQTLHLCHLCLHLLKSKRVVQGIWHSLRVPYQPHVQLWELPVLFTKLVRK
jgi:hypothetical protein